jgi:hypothetical protein
MCSVFLPVSIPIVRTTETAVLQGMVCSPRALDIDVPVHLQQIADEVIE